MTIAKRKARSLSVTVMNTRSDVTWSRVERRCLRSSLIRGYLGAAVFVAVALTTAGAQTLFTPGGIIGSSFNDKVGIGTNDPQQILHVAGGKVQINTGAPWDNFQISTDGTHTYLDANGDEDGLFIRSNTGKRVVLPDANLGIGIVAPQHELQLKNSSYISIMAVDGGYVPASWRRGSAGGLLLASAQTPDGGGWSFGSRIVNHDYGDGLALAFDTLTSGVWKNDALVISGRFGREGNIGLGTANPATKLSVVGDEIRLTRNGNDAMIRSVSTTAGAYFTAESATDGYFGMQLSQGNQGKWFVGSFGYSDLSIVRGSIGSSQRYLTVTTGGDIGIGTTTPTHKLSVNGTIRAKEVVVETTGWSDYVLEKSYDLKPLAEVEQHIHEHGHLPGIPTAADVAEKGVGLGEMQAKLLAKIEELTLHQIALEKRVNAQALALEALKQENATLRGQ